MSPVIICQGASTKIYMFTDDLSPCVDIVEVVDGSLEEWIQTLEDGGFRINGLINNEYLLPFVVDAGVVRIQKVELKRVASFLNISGLLIVNWLRRY